MNTYNLNIAEEEWNIDRTLTSGQVFRWTRHSNGGWYGYDGPYWYRIARESGGSNVKIDTSAPLLELEKLFRLNHGFTAVSARIIAAGPELAEAIAGLPGLRLMAPNDPVETIFCFLCSANNHLQRIAAMCRKLAEYGSQQESEVVGPWHIFPTLSQLAEVTEGELREKGFGYRARTIPLVASELASRGGTQYLEWLRVQPGTTQRTELIALPGVGLKLADCIRLFALHQANAVPIDTHIWQAFERLYGYEQPLTEKKYLAGSKAFEEKFGNDAGWAQQFLFFDNVLRGRAR